MKNKLKLQQIIQILHKCNDQIINKKYYNGDRQHI